MSNLEKQSVNHEQSHHSIDIEAEGKKQREHLKQELEQAVSETTSERDRDSTTAQVEALKQAGSSEELKTIHSKNHTSSPAERRGPITKKQLDARFKHTMKAVQDDLPPVSRNFSKFIHSKPIEKASDAIGNTIARPNALLAGAIGAFALTLAIYIFAKNMGYRLSGFEPIAAFLTGWILGLLYDYFRIMITGKKN